MQFNEVFRELTGNDPFPWQTRLYQHFIAAEWDRCSTCCLPTGLGKTAVIPIWLIALANSKGSLPRRLVYVVNRRTVVDQTTTEVEKLWEKLKSPEGKELGELHRALSELCATKVNSDTPPLAVSTLRGQLADNREWSADPSRAAVVCGTVDMIGSRLLFSGYGIGFRQRPLHAAFLAQDTLIVHDEAHLEEPFQRLIARIEQEQEQFTGISVAPKLRVMALTATPRDSNNVFGIHDDDRQDPIVDARLGAVKQLSLLPAAKESDVPAKIVERAVAFPNSDRAVLIFVRTIEHVKKIVDGLRKKKVADEHIEQLTGTLRGLERDNLVEKPVFRRFLPDARHRTDLKQGTVYLVCTSAGEVGVNISADDLVCDLSTFESMAQRFGRVNRFGQRDDSTVTIVHPTEFDAKKQIEIRREKTLALLQQLTSVNPHALDTLHPDKSKPDPREAAFAPPPTRVELTDILLDAWSMTSIRSRMPGRPDVEPYLRGIPDDKQPETHVAWREEVGVITREMFDDYPPQDLLELYPLLPHELLRDQSKRVFEELRSLAETCGERNVWLVDDYGIVDTKHTLATLTARDESLIEGKTVLLPHDVGGLNKQGMLDGTAPVPESDSAGLRRKNDVADVLREEGNPIRLRVDAVTDQTMGMRRILTIKWPENEGSETDEEPRTWFWFEKPLVVENSRNSVKPVLLDDHTFDVERGVEDILKGLSLETWIADALRLAAKWHDLGKCRERWQGGIGRPERWKDKWFAKSGRRWVARREGAYRHEFGSLLDVAQLDEFKQCDERTKDLVLHLIAAHHGMGRPHFDDSQTIDSNHAGALTSEMSIGTIRRFARLQRTFGHWGLAYIESILRAADWQASAKPSKYFEETAS